MAEFEMARGSLFRRAEIPEAVWFTRYNFHPEERFDVLKRLLEGQGLPSELLLAGAPGSGRRYLVEASRFRFGEPTRPVHVLEIDLEGYEEGGDLGAYLEHQATKRWGKGEETRREIGEAITELGKRSARLWSGPIAVAVSVAFQIAKPLRTLVNALDESPSAVAGPRFMAQEVFAGVLKSLDGQVVVHIVDAEQLHKVRSESSPWRWLAEIVERTPGALLAVSCERPEEVEAALPTLRYGVETLELRPLTLDDLQSILDLRYAPHEFPESLVTALKDYCCGAGSALLPGGVAQGAVRLRELGALKQREGGRWYLDEEAASEALAEGLWEPVSRFLYGVERDRNGRVQQFLLDAALCGDLVPARLLVELQGLDEEAMEEMEDLIEDGLVEKLGIFEDFEYRLATVSERTYVYRFTDPLVRRVILDRAEEEEREARARAVSGFLGQNLPARTRDVARVYLHLAEHLGEAERSRWRRVLAWWVGVEEAEELRKELLRELKAGELDPEVMWRVALESREIWPAYRRLSVLDAYEAGHGVSLEQRGRFLYERGEIFLELGQVHEALADAEAAESLLRVHEGRYGPSHLGALDLWGHSARQAGDLDVAGRKFKELLKVERRLLGEDHLSTLTTRHNLAWVLEGRGELDAARAEFEAVLKVKRRVLGEEASSTLVTRHNLAGVLESQGWLNEARMEYELVLEIQQRVLGEEHPSTLITRHNLAGVLTSQGKLNEARMNYDGVLEMRRRILGEEHPSTLGTRQSLARILEAQGDLNVARVEYEDILEIQRRVLGNEHPSTLATRHNRACVLRDQGELGAARVECEDILEVQRRVFGNEHSSTLATRHNRARVLRDQGELGIARTELEEVLDIQRRLLGEEHPSTLTTRHNWAWVVEGQGELDAARAAYEDLLEIRTRVLGEEHPSTLTTRHNLAGLLESQGELDAARAEYQGVLEARSRVLGEEHPYTLTTRHGLASVLQAQGELKAAGAEFEELLGMRRRLLGEEHPTTLITRYRVAEVLKEIGELRKARTELEETLVVAERVLPEDSDRLPEIRVGLAEVLEELGEVGKAEQEYQRVVESGHDSSQKRNDFVERAQAGLNRLKGT